MVDFATLVSHWQPLSAIDTTARETKALSGNHWHQRAKSRETKALSGNHWQSVAASGIRPS
jgi:hypothetical protein